MALTDPTTEAWVPTDTFGARLALIRQHFHWNVLEAATACGLVDQSWSNWEGGKIPRNMPEVCTKIAAATGADFTWLMVGGDLARSRCFAQDGWSEPMPGQLHLFAIAA